MRLFAETYGLGLMISSIYRSGTRYAKSLASPIHMVWFANCKGIITMNARFASFQRVAVSLVAAFAFTALLATTAVSGSPIV